MPKIKMPSDATDGMPNCGLVAMAIVAGTTVEKAKDAYQNQHRVVYGKYKRSNWKGSTSAMMLKRTLSVGLGVVLRDVVAGDVMLKTFARRIPEGRTYYVITTGHAQIVRRDAKGTYVADQRGVEHISNYWGSRKRVKAVWAVIDKDSR